MIKYPVECWEIQYIDGTERRTGYTNHKTLIKVITARGFKECKRWTTDEVVATEEDIQRDGGFGHREKREPWDGWMTKGM
jgi:hypothetical protein